MGELDQIAQRIEDGAAGDVGGAGLEGRIVVGVADFADLDDDGVDVVGAAGVDQVLRLGLVEEAGVPGIRPDAAVLSLGPRIQLAARMARSVKSTPSLQLMSPGTGLVWQGRARPPISSADNARE